MLKQDNLSSMELDSDVLLRQHLNTQNNYEKKK